MLLFRNQNGVFLSLRGGDPARELDIAIRNKINAGEEAWSTQEVCYIISKHVREFGVESKPAVQCASPEPRWEKPKPDFIKVNFDAAFKSDFDDGAFGYIL